jgi:hypothetical protein
MMRSGTLMENKSVNCQTRGTYHLRRDIGSDLGINRNVSGDTK